VGKNGDEMPFVETPSGEKWKCSKKMRKAMKLDER
jgi:hypothetical protein